MAADAMTAKRMTSYMTIFAFKNALCLLFQEKKMIKKYFIQQPELSSDDTWMMEDVQVCN